MRAFCRDVHRRDEQATHLTLERLQLEQVCVPAVGWLAATVVVPRLPELPAIRSPALVLEAGC